MDSTTAADVDRASVDEAKRRRVEKSWLGVGIVVAVAFGVLAPTWIADEDSREPAAVVEAYLTAIRDGDVAAAADVVGLDLNQFDGPFLRADATRGDWEVLDVQETGSRGNVSGEDERVTSATVVAVLVDSEGREAAGRWGMILDPDTDQWEPEHPLIEVRFPQSALWYLDVNGVTAPVDQVEQDDAESEGDAYKQSLFPGFYTFYQSVPDIVESEPITAPVFPNADRFVGEGDMESQHSHLDVDGTLPAPELTLTAKGEAAVQETVDDYIDHCAAISASRIAGCPFGSWYRLSSTAAWEIAEYPVAAPVANSNGIALAEREPGTAMRADWDSTHASCQIRLQGLEIGIRLDGSMTIIPNGGIGGPDEFAQEITETDC